MTVQETSGDRLTQAMKRAGLENGDVATAARVHVTTVSRWRNDAQAPKEAELDRVVALLKKHGVDVTSAWIRYGSNGTADRVSEARPRWETYGQILKVEFDSPTATQRSKAWIENFLLELLDAGADQDFLDWGRRFLLSHDNYALYKGGTRDEMTDEQKLKHMEALGVGIKAILKERVKREKVR